MSDHPKRLFFYIVFQFFYLTFSLSSWAIIMCKATNNKIQAEKVQQEYDSSTNFINIHSETLTYMAIIAGVALVIYIGWKVYLLKHKKAMREAGPVLPTTMPLHHQGQQQQFCLDYQMSLPYQASLSPATREISAPSLVPQRELRAMPPPSVATSSTAATNTPSLH